MFKIVIVSLLKRDASNKAFGTNVISTKAMAMFYLFQDLILAIFQVNPTICVFQE